jgi:hypothetical protein
VASSRVRTVRRPVAAVVCSLVLAVHALDGLLPLAVMRCRSVAFTVAKSARSRSSCGIATAAHTSTSAMMAVSSCASSIVSRRSSLVRAS